MDSPDFNGIFFQVFLHLERCYLFVIYRFYYIKIYFLFSLGILSLSHFEFCQRRFLQLLRFVISVIKTYMIYCVYQYMCVEPSLHLQNKGRFIVQNDIFVIYLVLACKQFNRNFYLCSLWLLAYSCRFCSIFT